MCICELRGDSLYAIGRVFGNSADQTGRQRAERISAEGRTVQACDSRAWFEIFWLPWHQSCSPHPLAASRGSLQMRQSWLNALVIRWPDEDTFLWIVAMQTLNQQDPCFLQQCTMGSWKCQFHLNCVFCICCLIIQFPNELLLGSHRSLPVGGQLIFTYQQCFMMCFV